MKKFSFLIIFAGTLVSSVFLLLSSVKAQSSSVDITIVDYEVSIDVDDNTNFTVTERQTMRFNGNMHGLRRDIPLVNNACAGATDLTCGGFEILIPLSITGANGEDLSQGNTKVYEYTNEDDSSRYLRFEWEVYPEGKYVNEEEFTWEIKYEVVGGMAVKSDFLGDKFVYFYWNLFGNSNNPSPIYNAKASIKFPQRVNLSTDNIVVYSNSPHDQNINNVTNTLFFEIERLAAFDEFTMSYKVKPSQIKVPGSLTLNFLTPYINNTIYFNGYEVFTTSGNEYFQNFPVGEHKFKIEHIGYEPGEFSVEVKEDKSSVIDIELKPVFWMSSLISLNTILTLIGVVGIPGAVYYGYLRYLRFGRDKDPIKTVIPLFKPPKGVHPYLLGSIIDESADPRDIAGSIVDLAYRGYLKIKEIKKGSNYELTKQKDFDTDESLSQVEKSLLKAIFGSKDTVQTVNLASSIEYAKAIKDIKSEMYSEMVEKGYFHKSPETVRNRYYAGGLGLIFTGIILFVGVSFAITSLLGFIAIFTGGAALAVLGVVFVFIARLMPAKTSLGSKVLNQILGFKMYLTTAERYRLQNLTPDLFEKYLSFAIVLKIEKQWAANFKDITIDKPSWYEGSGNLTDAIIFANLSNSFANTTETNIRNLATNTASKGGGWSGGGSFGGFSGGGGGGGFSGGW